VKAYYCSHASRSVFDCLRALSMLYCTVPSDSITVVLCMGLYGLCVHHDSVPVVILLVVSRCQFCQFCMYVSCTVLCTVCVSVGNACQLYTLYIAHYFRMV
jgi:hypothetical protein